MGENNVYLIDEQPKERRANRLTLTRLLKDPLMDIVVKDFAPLPSLSSYNALLADPNTAAFIIDQRLSNTGGVTYEGTRLASHLRSIDTKMPLYILTNFVPDAKGKGENAVEDIIDKSELRDGKGKLRFKSRFLRRLAVYRDVLTVREQRFHDLLVKSLNDKLTIEEQAEFDHIREARSLPSHAAELDQLPKLDKEIEKLKVLLKAVKKK